MADNKDLEHALTFVFGSEGGYSDDPVDRGGKTMMGITESTLIRAYQKGIVKHKDIKRLSRAEAAVIYEALYWQPSCAVEMPWPLCAIHFDAAVNHGVGGAVRLLQKTLNLYRSPDLSVDGAIGPKTKRVLYSVLGDLGMAGKFNAVALKCFCRQYLSFRAKYFQAIVANDPSQKRFINGWMNRVRKNEQLVDRWQG